MELINNCYKHNRNTEQVKSNIPIMENINISNDINTFAKLNILMLNNIAETYKIKFFCHNGKIIKTNCQ